MKYRSYNKEFKIATAQFIDLFNDIRIDRRDNRDTVQQIISVPCVFGNRSRILKSIENRNKTLKVPLLTCTMENFARDNSRVCDVNSDLLDQHYDSAADYNPWLKRPVPINITYEVAAVAKYQEDIDQILTNFIPFFNPDVYVVWPHPKDPFTNIKSQVVWGGTVQMQYSTDVSETTQYRILAVMTFTYKTYVFAGMGRDGGNGPLIHRINFCPNMISIGDEGYMMDRWYDVPTSMPFADYRQNIICGLIKPDHERNNWDWLPMYGTSGSMVSGYWSDISGLVSGDLLGRAITDNPCFLVTDSGNILLMNENHYFSPGMEEADYYSLWLQSVSGRLSGCVCW